MSDAKISDDTQNAILDAVAKGLRELGWSPAVIGGFAIQMGPGGHAHQYEFAVRFTGKAPE